MKLYRYKCLQNLLSTLMEIFWRLSHIDFPAKIGFAITNVLAESVNSSVTYNFVNTWGYGDMNKPDKLVGMMGHLIRNEIDVGGKFHQNLFSFEWFQQIFFFSIYRHCSIHNTGQSSTYRIFVSYIDRQAGVRIPCPTFDLYK